MALQRGQVLPLCCQLIPSPTVPIPDAQLNKTASRSGSQPAEFIQRPEESANAGLTGGIRRKITR